MMESSLEERMKSFRDGYVQGYLRALKDMNSNLWTLAQCDSEPDVHTKIWYEHLQKKRVGRE